ncbi:fungal specific transcription factor, putative [Trichophyton verrucosum HKI 0517]|uniref:Fungal specific transcription factor, putative n=1 Tax=Trichophyton verrucosum (strain HKI 0517) TaxID=663202 RepID=D4D6V6_TRIVH|nr:fungal specific transcription factor, putative [Trichophyton verrucosum HKI 0517]EFE42394.1 fungal specific transcription factor, putative [Trichophyton verrucosum HKI 0517]
MERLRHYENVLRDAGIPFEPFDTERMDKSTTDSTAQAQGEAARQKGEGEEASLALQEGKLITHDANKKYYEHQLLASLGDELKQNLHGMPIRAPSTGLYSSYLLLGSMASSPPAEFPSRSEIFKLWSTFCDNVDPLTKILHIPSANALLTQSLRSEESDFISQKLQGLIFAICACAVMSIGDNECQDMLGSSISLESLLAATAASLVESSFMQSLDLITLQTYVLFLTALQRDCEPSCFWTLVGIAIRIAQTIGIHQDGTKFSLSPYETEMRRRLWWYIVSLDIRATEMAGSGKATVPQSWTTTLPLNINDEDISSDMATFPSEHLKVTEMSFPLLRYETSRFLQAPGNGKLSGNLEDTIAGSSFSSSRIKNLKRCFEERFLRFCDPVILLHVLLTVTARSTICKLQRISEVFYASDKNRLHSLNNTETKILYGIKMLQYDELVHATKSSEKFRWYVVNYFPWEAVIGMLKAITAQETWNDGKETAWNHIKDVYNHHPEFSLRSSGVSGVVSKLTLAAWETRLQTSNSMMAPKLPGFIERLYSHCNQSSNLLPFNARTPSLEHNHAATHISPGLMLGDQQLQQTSFWEPQDMEVVSWESIILPFNQVENENL